MLKNLKLVKLFERNRNFSIIDLFYCVLFVIICDTIGYLGSLFQTESLETWYPLLQKSILTPPSFVFAFIWGLLYAILGISTFLAFKSSKRQGKSIVLMIFSTQLCFNLLWSIFFFGMRMPFIAFIEILFLAMITIQMMKVYKRYNFASYLLLYPYILWIIFATYLNFVIVLKN